MNINSAERELEMATTATGTSGLGQPVRLRDQTAGGGPPVNGEYFADDMRGWIERAFLRAGGLSREAVRRRPIIGICSSWSELNPCNMGLHAI